MRQVRPQPDKEAAAPDAKAEGSSEGTAEGAAGKGATTSGSGDAAPAEGSAEVPFLPPAFSMGDPGSAHCRG